MIDKGGKVKTPAHIGIRFHTLVLGDGSQVALRTEPIIRTAENPTGSSTKKIGGAAVAGAILGGIIGGGKGAATGAAIGAGGGTAAVMSRRSRGGQHPRRHVRERDARVTRDDYGRTARIIGNLEIGNLEIEVDFQFHISRFPNERLSPASPSPRRLDRRLPRAPRAVSGAVARPAGRHPRRAARRRPRAGAKPSTPSSPTSSASSFPASPTGTIPASSPTSRSRAARPACSPSSCRPRSTSRRCCGARRRRRPSSRKWRSAGCAS